MLRFTYGIENIAEGQLLTVLRPVAIFSNTRGQSWGLGAGMPLWTSYAEVSLTGLRDLLDGTCAGTKGCGVVFPWSPRPRMATAPMGPSSQGGGIDLENLDLRTDANLCLWFPSAELGQTGIFKGTLSNSKSKCRL